MDRFIVVKRKRDDGSGQYDYWVVDTDTMIVVADGINSYVAGQSQSQEQNATMVAAAFNLLDP